jgi:hypothetical protein
LNHIVHLSGVKGGFEHLSYIGVKGGWVPPQRGKRLFSLLSGKIIYFFKALSTFWNKLRYSFSSFSRVGYIDIWIKRTQKLLKFWWSLILEKHYLWILILLGRIGILFRNYIYRGFHLDVALVMELGIYGKNAQTIKGHLSENKRYGLRGKFPLQIWRKQIFRWKRIGWKIL